MKKMLTQSKIFVVFVIIFAFKAIAPQAELIEPSRSLENASGDLGQLTVFSEPPDQDVTLDGAPIGSTPIRVKSLDPGIHQLQVGKSATQVHIASGKTLHISLFRNRFIVFDKVQKEATISDSSLLESDSSRVSETPPQPLPIQKENRKAWNRWMQFVNGTSRHF